MEVETSNWSGDGSFTQILIDWIRHLDEVVLLRVEDAPASRSESGYNFISNELYVAFRVRHRLERARRLGIWPVTRSIPERVMTLEASRARSPRWMASAPRITRTRA